MSIELVRRHEPVLHFDRRENFFPMTVDAFVGDCSLHIVENEQRVMYIPPKFVQLDYLDDEDFSTMDNCLVYADRQEVEPANVKKIEQVLQRHTESRADFLSFVKQKLHDTAFKLGADLAQTFKPLHNDKEVFEAAFKNYSAFKDQNPNYYYRLLEGEKGYTVIQYWYFYAYNDFATNHQGINDHEGDWESIHLFFKDVDAKPTWVAYSAHGGAARKAWQDVERDGDHPIVYVAAGSHAGYYRPGEHGADHNDPGHLAAGGSTGKAWAVPESLEDKSWCAAYLGRWGARKVDSFTHRVGDPMGGPPSGPAWNRAGDPRPAWADPVHYAGLD